MRKFEKEDSENKKDVQKVTRKRKYESINWYNNDIYCKYYIKFFAPDMPDITYVEWNKFKDVSRYIIKAKDYLEHSQKILVEVGTNYERDYDNLFSGEERQYEEIVNKLVRWRNDIKDEMEELNAFVDQLRKKELDDYCSDALGVNSDATKNWEDELIRLIELSRRRIYAHSYKEKLAGWESGAFSRRVSRIKRGRNWVSQSWDSEYYKYEYYTANELPDEKKLKVEKIDEEIKQLIERITAGAEGKPALQLNIIKDTVEHVVKKELKHGGTIKFEEKLEYDEDDRLKWVVVDHGKIAQVAALGWPPDI
jgi:hypothetical protein